MVSLTLVGELPSLSLSPLHSSVSFLASLPVSAFCTSLPFVLAICTLTIVETVSSNLVKGETRDKYSNSNRETNKYSEWKMADVTNSQGGNERQTLLSRILLEFE